ncbi:hypothetical protein PINS_up003077 [Pythium insidiosum]|nr:hypothetical protein PINS_up003077 [Pythium insidiosum]
MELAPEVIAAILQSGPEYADEEQVLRRKLDDASWREYKHLRLLELSKHRWPDAKVSFRHPCSLSRCVGTDGWTLVHSQKHLRVLSNGHSVMLHTPPTELERPPSRKG